MTQTVKKARIMNKAGTETYWTTRNPRLLLGEFAIVDVGNGRRRIKIGDGVNRFNDLQFYDESAGAFQGNADPSVLPTATGNIWYFAGPGTYTNFLDVNGNPIVVDAQLAILSRVNGIWSKLDIIASDSWLETRYIIKLGGTVGVDCDATGITTLYDSITTATSSNRYVFEILPGIYSELGPSNVGLVLKDYMDLVGYPGYYESPDHSIKTDRVIIKGPEGSTGSAEAAYSALYISGSGSGNANVRNIDFVAYKSKFALNANIGNNKIEMDCVFENCNFQHYGGAGTINYYDARIEPYYNQRFHFINCNFKSTAGLQIMNNPVNTSRGNNYGFTVELKGCKGYLVKALDYLQYSRDKIIFTGNEFDIVQHEVNLSVYSGSPGIAEINRGFYPNLIQWEENGNKIGKVVIDSTGDYLTVTNNNRPVFRGYNKRMYNVSGTSSNVLKGYAVTKNINAALPNAFNTAAVFLQTEQLAPMDNTNAADQYSFVGFTEQDINYHTMGTVRLRQKGGIAIAAFDTVNGSVVYGSEIQIQADGRVAKYSAGVKIGIARAANAGGYVEFEMY